MQWQRKSMRDTDELCNRCDAYETKHIPDEINRKGAGNACSLCFDVSVAPGLEADPQDACGVGGAAGSCWREIDYRAVRLEGDVYSVDGVWRQSRDEQRMHADRNRERRGRKR